MKRQQLYSAIICSTSFLLLGTLLFYPLISHEAIVPNDSNQDYTPSMDYSTDIQCKRVNIDTTAMMIRTGVKGGTTTECPTGYVATGITNGALNLYNDRTGEWLFDTNPDEWGITVEYTQGTMSFSRGNDSLNRVDLICAPRKIEFKDGPCVD